MRKTGIFHRSPEAVRTSGELSQLSRRRREIKTLPYLHLIIENSESEIIRSDGKRIPIQRTVIPIMLDDQEHLLESFADISRLKKAEEKKQTLEHQLRQSQKIQAIGTLAGGIAHDFNNILTPIMVNTEVSLLDIPNESPVRRQLEAVLDAGKRARDLVKQILVFSRHGEQERKALQISVIVKEAIKLIKVSLPETIEIHEHVRADSGLVLADPTQIHQVLMNLCTNAAHAMREKGGTLKITSGPESACGSGPFPAGSAVPASFHHH